MLALGGTLPLVVTQLEEAAIALWYVFMTIATLQLVADIGFGGVLARFYSYAIGGAVTLGVQHTSGISNGGQGANVDLLARVYATTQPIYLALSTIWLLAVTGFGSWIVAEYILVLERPSIGIAACVAVALTTAYRLYGNRYSTFLYGVGEITTWRRWESLTWLSSSVCAIAVLLAGAGLLGLTMVMFGLLAVNVTINRILVERKLRVLGCDRLQASVDREVLRQALPRTWRAGLGVFAHVGVAHASALAVAKLEPTATATSYLLAYNVMRAVDQLAQAPFYTKLPAIAGLCAQGRVSEFRSLVARGMRLSYWTLTAGLTLVALIGPSGLKAIGSNVQFVERPVWAVMALAVFAERFGAMHLNCYMATNRIVMHVANGIAGVLVIVFAVILYPVVGLIGVPTALLLANVFWFAIYSARKSYPVLGAGAVRFEATTSLGAVAVLLLGLALSFVV